MQLGQEFTEIISENKKIMAQEMDIVPRTMSRIIKQDLGLGTFKWQTGQCLAIALKEIGKKKSRCVLLLYGKEHYKEIIFTDENIFTVEETINKQNDRVYALSSREARELILRIEQTSVMIWQGVSYDGVTSLGFCEKGFKTAGWNYQWDVLQM